MKTQRIVKSMMWAVLGCVLAAASANAAQRGSIMGKIKSVSDDKTSIVITRTDKNHKGEEVTATLTPKTRYYLYVRGDATVLENGANVKAYGKISEDMTKIDGIGHICVLPAKSNVTDKKRRLDGVLVKTDGKITGIEHKGQAVAATAKDKISVEIVTVSSADELAVGRKVMVGGVLGDEGMTKVEELRYYGAK